MRTRIRPAAVLVVAATIALSGCGSTPSEPTPVTLADLVTAQDDYDGAQVVAEGTVQDHDDPPHAWIEDADQHRVELLPYERVAELVGDEVRVTGQFTFEPDRGRAIEIDDLEVLRPAEDVP